MHTELRCIAPRWFAKLESQQITGSMKLRSADRILREARLPEGSTVIESTSGNMGVALAACARARKLKAILITDLKLSPYHRAHMLQAGAEVMRVNEKDKTGGWLLTRLQTVKDLVEENPDWFWINQYENAWAPIAFESIAIEIVKDLLANDVRIYPETTLWYFAAVGTGGSLSGSGRALRRLCHPKHGILRIPRIRVVAVDAEGSAIFGRPPATRHLNGIGSSLNTLPNLQRDLIDDVVIVNDRQAFSRCWSMRRKYDLYLGGSSGAVLDAIIQKIDLMNQKDIVIALCPDAGEIYADTLYAPVWLRNRGLGEVII